MNAPYPSDPSLRTPVATDAPQMNRQAPSVPISVYRELATELKATQVLVDSLTQQNQQLTQQNDHLRQEMIRFADSAHQLRLAVESSQPQGAEPHSHGQAMALRVPTEIVHRSSQEEASTSLPERLSDSLGEGVSGLANQFGQMVKSKPAAKAPRGNAKSQGRPPKRPQPQPPVLYTEERLEPSRSPQFSEKTTDLSGLWLATTILLIVVSAFGAGFLIMRPVLNNAR